MKPVRFAILGAARIARLVAPRIQAVDGAELSAIASRSPAKAARFADEFAVPRTFGSYEAALQDPEIDAVYLPLPPSMHPEWTTRAAEAGKHVLCEKPLATTVEEADRMIAVCQRHNVVLLDGVMWYHTPRAAAVKQVVSSDQLGSLKQINAVFTFRWDEFPLENVRMQRSLGGGALLDLGWYCVGAALWIFADLPHRVMARAQYHHDVDTRLNAILEFSDGRVATIECGFETVRRRWLEVAGTDGNLVCDDFARPWDEHRPRFWTHDDQGQATEHVVRHKPQEEHMIEQFCAFVRDAQVETPWLELSRSTQLVCDALARSAQCECPIRLDSHRRVVAQ